MQRKKRIEYLVVTLSCWVSGSFSYGIANYLNGNNYPFLFYAILGGFLVSATVSTFYLFHKFIKKRSLKFKIIAAVLWQITLACTILVGAVCYFPYQIYNLILIIKNDERG